MTKSASRRLTDRSRRTFLKSAAAAALAGPAAGGAAAAAGHPVQVALVPDPGDFLMSQPPAQRALEALQQSLQRRGVSAARFASTDQAPPGAVCVLTAGKQSLWAREALHSAELDVPDASEALALARGQAGKRPVLLATGADQRGLAYAIRELADIVEHAPDPIDRLRRLDAVVQRPANRVRSVARLFTSELEDKPWFYDRAFWRRYLEMLVHHRWNRFNLTLGLGYNRPRGVRDSYFYFAYPFLVRPPGYDVRAVGLPEAERERNLEMLRWVSDLAVELGLHFQLALWTHAYALVDSPEVNYQIAGLTPERHAAYCRDALRAVLEACPSIQGVTFRCHSESGVPEGSYDFWRTVFDGARRAGRPLEIDIHGKGIEHALIEMALERGAPVSVSPKYWAEHLGLPYHQAAIRELERRPPPPGAAVSRERRRRFTRYGYADYLAEGRRHEVLFRIWPGTQRHLLGGDPALAAGYGRHAHFCDALGLELCEPLSFKGRMGSGKPGGRDGYADPRLKPPGGDWQKYAYTYRLWGRLLYDPETPADAWRRWTARRFRGAAADCEAALAAASRVLPLVTTAHDPSASNNAYWPELYTNMPLVDAGAPHPYRDTPAPRVFGTVSPLDPAWFSTVEELVDELATGRRSGKYSPLDVARWLERLAREALGRMEQARRRASDPEDPEFRRWDIDVRIQAHLGRFFCEKLRAAAAFAVFRRTGDHGAKAEAVRRYEAARTAWAAAAETAAGVYVEDLTYGLSPHLRGHWSDRLAAIDADLEAVRRAAGPPRPGPAAAELLERFQALAAGDPAHRAGPDTPRPQCRHWPPERFGRGEPVELWLAPEAGYQLRAVRLHYRRVNQAEAYRTADMEQRGRRWRAEIPADYTDTEFPLLYFFQLDDGAAAWRWPGLNHDLANQPYFVIRQRA